MNSKSLILLLSLASVTVGCSNGGSGGGGASSTPKVPNTLQEHSVAQMKPLTKEEKDKLKDLTKKTEIIPGTSLILVPENESSQDKEKRLEKIKALGPATKAVYSDILNKCKIIQPKTSSSGLDSEPQAGSVLNQTSSGSIGGADCPIVAVDGTESITKIESISKDASGNISGMATSGTGESTSELLVASRDLQNKAEVTGWKNSVKFSSVVEFNQTNFKMYINATGEMNLNSIKYGSIPLKLSMEGLANGEQSESYFEVSGPFPFADVSMQMFSKNGENRYFVNGEQISEKEFKELMSTDTDFGKPSVK